MTKIKWDEPYNQYQMPYRRSWLWTGLGGVVFWVALVSLLVGCAPSTAQLQTMTGVELYYAHHKAKAQSLFSHFDMRTVRELRARGGITDKDVEWYEQGQMFEHETMFKCWGDFSFVGNLGYSYDWEAMGYENFDEWVDEMAGLAPSLGGTNIYTSRGVINVRNLGGGSFRTRRMGGR